MKTNSCEINSLVRTGHGWIAIITITFLTILIPGTPSLGQQAPSDGRRKAVQKVEPGYPQIARTLKLSGTVRVAVKIAPNGKVVSAEALGGHPVFTQVAVDAVRQWRFESAGQQTEEVVILNFQP